MLSLTEDPEQINTNIFQPKSIKGIVWSVIPGTILVNFCQRKIEQNMIFNYSALALAEIN